MIRRLWAFLLAALLALLSVAAPVQADSTQTVEAVNHSAFALPHAKDTYLPWQQAQAPPLQLAGINLDGNIRDLQGISIFTNPRAQLNTLLTSLGSTVADYQPGNYTGTLNASAWLNSIGAAPSLAQASGAAQPIILPFGGQKYAYLPGVVRNAFSTPVSASTNPTGKILDFAFLIDPNSISGTLRRIFGDTNVVNSYWAEITATGTVAFNYYISSVAKKDTSTASLAGAGVQWLRIFHDPTSGNTIFYTQAYAGSTAVPTSGWAQLGTTVVGSAGNIDPDTGNTLYIGEFTQTDSNVFLGKIYRASAYWGDLTSGGVLKWDFNASDWPETTTNGATAVSSTTGETWTLANTGTLLAQIVGSPQLVFDGAAMFMQMATTLVQPEFMIAVVNQVTKTPATLLFDGASAGSGALRWNSSQLYLQANTQVTTVAPINLTTNTYGIAYWSINGASSFIGVNGTQSAIASTPGALNMSGLTVGSAGGGLASFINEQVKEIIILSAVPSAAKLAQILNLLNRIYHIYAPYASANDWLNELPTVAANDETYRLAANGR